MFYIHSSHPKSALCYYSFESKSKIETYLEFRIEPTGDLDLIKDCKIYVWQEVTLSILTILVAERR